MTLAATSINQLKKEANNFEWFSLALNELTDTTDTYWGGQGQVGCDCRPRPVKSPRGTNSGKTFPKD